MQLHSVFVGPEACHWDQDRRATLVFSVDLLFQLLAEMGTH